MTQPHCHWTYSIEGYNSFLSWPTRPDLERDVLVGHPHPDQIRVYQTHGIGCETPTEEHE